MTEVILYKTLQKGWKVFGLTIPFVIIGIWMIREEAIGSEIYYMGWLCICFFGLGIPIALFHIFDRRPQIIINENGIWDRTTNQDEIKWEQIKGAYPLDIAGQKFISIITDETFVLKKKQYKWAARINKEIGAQQLNLHLAPLNIDENQFTQLINALSKTEKKNRRKLILEFEFNREMDSAPAYLKALLYILISLGLLIASLNSRYAFIGITAIIGITAVIARWFSGTNNKSKLRKYAEIITYLGFINLFLSFVTIKIYEYTTNDIGFQVSTKIENYKAKFNHYPKQLEDINESLNFNILQKYILDRIEYKATDKDYILELETWSHKRKEFDKESKEWI